MKLHAATALALSLAFTQMAAPAALAQQATQQFRAVETQSFSEQDLQRYGLSQADASQVAALQQSGYQVQLISEDEARQQYAGQFSNSQWLVIGLIVVVVVVAVAVAD